MAGKQSNVFLDSFQQQCDLRLTGDLRRVPADIEDWLGRLFLLYGVPFHYLVPEEDMLPRECIRFFYLDPGWVKCLLEGACSVGMSSTVDDLVDRHLRNRFLDLAGKKAKSVRAGKEGQLNWPLSGFLLRSRIVEGWQGLEMKSAGVDANGNHIDPLEPLRIDRLNPETMLCIFNGKVTEIDIAQPPEDLHFGATSAGANAYQKVSLRKLFPAAAAGDAVAKSTIEVPMRAGVQRVVDIRTLGLRMRDALNAAQAIDGTAQGRFTSAEFGVQMIESPAKAKFRVKQGK